MIYTVTFNPSLDYVVRVTEFVLGNLHRTQTQELFVGGKGINVSTVLKELGVENTALGFAAGFTGNEIIRRLNEMGLSSDFIHLSQGVSRINIKLKSNKDVETEINGQGPVIEQQELEQFNDRLSQMKERDFLVLSGSVPHCLDESIYADICKKVKNKNIKVVIDAEGELLRNALRERPFLIKPNLQELEKLFDRALFDENGVLECAKELRSEGAKNVLVSLGEEGALLLDEHGTIHRQTAPKGKVTNSVGAGDSLIAGFLTKLIKLQPEGATYSSEDYQRALRLGVAAGSAGAFAAGLPDKMMINSILQQMNQ